ncbi:glycosyltransferase family 2 protein [Mycolicibacterium sp. 018/SC-01/001]|uniref:glycosyltransferase family 2 protein n=1 Tax=Mycolicibacterium sp. 018/SC-01/001 TaxID=2592069 RepID=UPI00117F9630|nr:glycosyltransferase family 2 protein [Mycolicibacterium sp. 018/SC-01/001]TRW82853.1 glycosyltransferase family 2 protein [Mycolicibacterium sp. 018/SC-01/001]
MLLQNVGDPQVRRGARSLSVVVCAYTVQRWDDLCRSVGSVLAEQAAEPDTVSQLVIVIDHNEELFARVSARFGGDPRITLRRNAYERGLSGARNTGVAASTGEIVAFLDDDAAAQPGWSAALVRHYDDPQVVGVGGHAAPVWPQGRPRWMPAEFDWVVGCSYVGQPERLASVRNPLGCNMSLRRSVFAELGGFRSEVGRVGAVPVGGEETELFLRVRSQRPTHRVLLDPSAAVSHHVSADRATPRYFLRRCYHEGMSKAVVTRLAAAPKSLDSEQSYATRVLPRAVIREVTSRQPGGRARAAMIVAGLVVTTAGYVRGVVSGRGGACS